MNRRARLTAMWAAAQLFRVYICAALLMLCVNTASSRPERVSLFPKMRAGQTLTYDITYRSDKQVDTKSSMVADSTPGPAQIDVRALLRLEVLEVIAEGQRARIHARTWLDPPPDRVQAEQAPAKSVEFTILPDGHLDAIKGLEELTPEQQQAWHEWVSRFTLAPMLTGDAAKLSSKWKSQEAEKSPAPIAALTWVKESTYARNEPCSATKSSTQGVAPKPDQQPEMCAVLLTTATLKQHSSEKDATPEDFQLHQLRTSGTASGKNKIITYISLRTGLLVRATEEADQTMDVTIAKADGTNRVRYNVTATSYSEVLLVEDAPPMHP